jgi:hypothetical protein
MTDILDRLRGWEESARCTAAKISPRALTLACAGILVAGFAGMLMFVSGSSADIPAARSPDTNVAAAMSRAGSPFDRMGMRCADQTWPYLSGPCMRAPERTVRMLPQGRTDRITTVTTFPQLRTARELELAKQRPADAAARAQAQLRSTEMRRHERRYRSRHYRRW